MKNQINHVKFLEKAGHTKKQAEASIRVLAKVMSDELITKDYFDKEIGLFKSDVDHRFNEMKLYVDHRFNEMKLYVDHRFDEMKLYVDHRFDEMKTYVDRRCDEVTHKLTVRMFYMMTTFTLIQLAVIKFMIL